MKMINDCIIVEFFPADTSTALDIPIVSTKIPAGFPSPASDFEENSLDLNTFLIKHKTSTFFAKVSGDSMKNAGVHDGDLLVVDRSLEASNRDIAVCYLNGEYTVKRLVFENDAVWLVPENDRYEAIKVDSGNELIIWGIVISVVKKFK